MTGDNEPPAWQQRERADRMVVPLRRHQRSHTQQPGAVSQPERAARGGAIEWPELVQVDAVRDDAASPRAPTPMSRSRSASAALTVTLSRLRFAAQRIIAARHRVAGDQVQVGPPRGYREWQPERARDPRGGDAVRIEIVRVDQVEGPFAVQPRDACPRTPSAISAGATFIPSFGSTACRG